MVDSTISRISLTTLSMERRQELIQLMKQKVENGKIILRQERQEGMTKVKKEDSLSTILR